MCPEGFFVRKPSPQISDLGHSAPQSGAQGAPKAIAMTTTTAKKLTFEEFLEQYPDGLGIYELVNGQIVQVEPTRAHKNVARYLVKSFDREIERLGLDYIVDKDIVVKTVTNFLKEQGRNPDVSVVSASKWNSNVMAYGALTEPIQLAVEVVSTNWEDDYVDKLDEYQRLGIPEYWIVDYLALSVALRRNRF